MENINELFPGFDSESLKIVRAAYDIAAFTLKDFTRSNGKPFLEHPVNVALIAAREIGLPAGCVAAVFLHEAMRMNPDITLDGIKPLIRRCSCNPDGAPPDFGKDVYTMVDGLNKIALIKPKDTKLEADNYKKLIVSYSKDPRVTVLKLADRLEVMRNLDMFPKLSKERKILETLMLYIPLAHQLGLYNMKSEMEDIYFRFAEPEQYRAITNKLKSTENDRQQLMTDFIEPLKKKLSDAGIIYKLKVRTKTAWSIWKKMQKQKVPFEGVYDVFAIRFIIDCEPDRKMEHELCWKVFSYVTEEYESDTKRLRDWLSNPKPNGYESLHITVKNRQGAYLEVQIRTKRMDEMAESGLASHWSYKGIKHEAALDSWLSSVRSALEHPKGSEGDPSAGYYEDELPQPPSKEIFVFTPSGELRRLPVGASVLDFAFDIHSNLGIRCTGGKVNGKAVSIREKLSTGDVVEIMSGKNQKPNSGWLNFIVTSKARSKIRQMLSEEEFKKAADGKELLERRLKNWKLDISDEELAAFLKKNGFKTLNAFYAAIGEGELDINDIKAYIIAGENRKDSEVTSQQNPVPKSVKQDEKQDNGPVIIENMKSTKGFDIKMAKCCNPVYGDDIFGFLSQKEGIKIHRMSCPNAARLLEKYSYRILRTRWSQAPSLSSFQVELRITADLEPSVTNEIFDVVNSFKASIRSFHFTENNKHDAYQISAMISVPSNMELDKVISQIRALRHVQKVSRG